MQEYNNTDRQIHWLSQVLAKTNRAYVAEKEDDSHTNLSYDSISNRVFGRWIDTSKGKVILALNLERACFEWLDNKLSVTGSIAILNKNLAEIENEVAKYPMSNGLKDAFMSKPLHFKIPEYGIQSISNDGLSAQGLKIWKYYRELSNVASMEMLGHLQAESEVRIWPHHFDTGVYAQVNNSLGLGFGLAMEDAKVGEPYFYIAGYAGHSSIKYENLNKLSKGKWLLDEQWKGAVLPLSGLPVSSFENSLEDIRRYLQESINWFLGQ